MRRLVHFASPCLLAALAAPSFSQAVAPAPGDLAISEICHTPICAGSQNTGEWFEVTNISAKVLDLNGLYFQDGPTPASGGKFFQVLPSVATLPALMPGERFLFGRSNNPVINGGLFNVDYAYAAIGSTSAPADHSQVSETQMNFSSQDADGMHITKNAPFASGGVLIDSVSFRNGVPPFVPGFDQGYTAERVNLFAPMQFDFPNNVNGPNCALASITTGFGSCTPFTDFGTPRLLNFSDASTWGTVYDDPAFPNAGTMSAKAPASVSGGVLLMRAGGGPVFAPLFFGYAASAMVPGLPIGAFFPGNPGSIVIDLATAQYVGVTSFDGAGAADFALPIPNLPSLVGVSLATQWLAIGPGFVIEQSKGLLVAFTL